MPGVDSTALKRHEGLEPIERPGADSKKWLCAHGLGATPYLRKESKMKRNRLPGTQTKGRDGFATDANVVAVHRDAGPSQETSADYTARLAMASKARPFNSPEAKEVNS